jgi:hypothetical protein
MQQLTNEIARQREQELRNLPQRADVPLSPAPNRVVIRLAADYDWGALRRLALLEGAELAPGRWLLGEADGHVSAALRLDDGSVLADPFVPTAAMRGVLELWARQLSGRRAGLRGRLRLA